MLNLFTNQDVAAIAISEYVAWFLDQHSPNHNLIQLPPIQRNAVWNIAQVERLWDSMLRGFPIGSVLLANRAVGQSARPLTSNQQSQAITEGYFLLDGQQRTRALLLGFQPTATSRLWVDLDPRLRFDNPEYNDRQFMLRLLTGHQPWGMRSHNAEEKLSESRKAEARQILGDARRYDYLIFPVPQPPTNAMPSWPVDARMPVPLDALIQLCGGWSGQFTVPAWEQVCQLAPPHLSMPEASPAHFAVLMAALERLLTRSSVGSQPSRSIPLLLHPEPAASDTTSTDNVPDSVETLFRRVNAGGTVLAGEEMAYSLLKSSWDQAYDLVSQIVQHEQVGYLFPPTGVVMAAARLARRKQGHLRDLSASIPQFRRWLSQTPSAAEPISFLAAMQELLSPPSGQPLARFAQVLVEFCRLALYNPASTTADSGLPQKLLLAIHPMLLHPILCWVLDNLDESTRLQANRLPVLRYLMYVLIMKPEAQKFGRLASDVLGVQTAGQDFPDRAIYQRWLQEAAAAPMPSQGELLADLPAHTTAGWFSHAQELFGPSDATDERPANPFHSFRQQFWHHRALILWFQRAYLQQWFTGYNPMSQDAADTPYDYDHIVPYSHVVSQGRSMDLQEGGEGANRFDWYRRFYVNSVGNYRAWPAWANRSDGNECHTDKLHLKNSAPLQSEAALELKLESSADFLRASAIPAADVDLWLAAGGWPGHWPAARRAAWQKAVERRASSLYDELFATLGYDNWQGITAQLI